MTDLQDLLDAARKHVDEMAPQGTASNVGRTTRVVGQGHDNWMRTRGVGL